MTETSLTPINRLMLGSPLSRRRNAIILVSILLAILTFATVQLLAIFTSLKPDAALIFLTALATTALLSVVPVAILWYLDRRERESPWAIAVALLWGGIIATGLSAPINGQIINQLAGWVSENPMIQETLGPQAALLIGAPIAGPLVEETIKGIGILALLIFLNAEFDNMRDGFIYGALVGIGFNWLESALYVAQTYAEYGFAPWGLQLGARFALFGLSGHTLYSGILGIFLGLMLQTTRNWVGWLAIFLGWFLAVLAHAVNNSLGLVFAIASRAAGAPTPTGGPPPNPGFLETWFQKSILDLIMYAPFILLLIVMLWRSGVWERRVIREELLDEVGQAVTPEEYEAIRRDRMFQSRRIPFLNKRISDQLVKAQHELAFRKRRVRKLGLDLETDPLVLGWRHEAQRLRAMSSDGDRPIV
ncbi:PrsW family intramembrane metalloprotease [Leptolyngbya sp. FACHB-16]|nr:PrsW family intramembrane metalloprotease [Leptolyngbya sp. FACHB-8]MBD2158704.1 PrsW family intramembrane metalloprotease [Leptolyngbya sp. FACHB-16]